jgi:hypothetical protein
MKETKNVTIVPAAPGWSVAIAMRDPNTKALTEFDHEPVVAWAVERYHDSDCAEYSAVPITTDWAQTTATRKPMPACSEHHLPP